MTVLFQNGTANGVSPNVHKSEGGQHVITISGNFDGATVQLQVKSLADPNNEWVLNKIYSASENDPVTFLPRGYQARGEIFAAGASTDIFMEIRT